MTQLEDDKPWLGPLPAMPDCDCHICRPDASYDELDRRTIDSVLEHGWQVIMVGANTGCSHPQHQDHSADDHSDPGPAFAYTVGLGHRFGHPELLVSDSTTVMHGALNNVLNGS